MQLTELDLNHIAVQCRRLPIRGKDRHLSRLAFALLYDFDGLTPRGTLCIVNLAQILPLALDHPVTPAAAVLVDAPVAVLLAVLESLFRSEKHTASVSENTAISRQ